MVKSNRGPKSVEDVTIACAVQSKITTPRLFDQLQLASKNLPDELKTDNPFTSEHRDELCTMISRLPSAYHDFNVKEPNGVKTSKDILKESNDVSDSPRSPEAFALLDNEIYNSLLSLQRLLNTGKIIDETQISSRSTVSLSYYHKELIKFINDNPLSDDQPKIHIDRHAKGAWMYTTTFNQYIHAYVYVYELQHEGAGLYASSDKLVDTSLGEFISNEWNNTGRSLLQLSGLSLNNIIRYKKKEVGEIEVKGIKVFSFNKLLKYLIVPKSEQPNKNDISNDALEALDSFSNYMRDAKESRNQDKKSANNTAANKEKRAIKAEERKRIKKEKDISDNLIKESLVSPKRNTSPPKSRR